MSTVVGIQVTLAVTLIPADIALWMPSRMCGWPPMRSRKRDWSKPGIRRAGDVKVMRRDGQGRTSRYFVEVSMMKTEEIRSSHILKHSREPSTGP